MLVYDVNYLKSFDTLDNWHDEFLKQVGNILELLHIISLRVLSGVSVPLPFMNALKSPIM